MTAPATLPGAPPSGGRPAVHCEGRCGGRLLTDGLSRMLRMGPCCRDVDFRERRHDVEQDALPGL